jgi:hypothetical protein
VEAGSLKAEFGQQADGTSVVSLSGSIDENADLQSVFSRLDRATILNLQKIERVNSMGVHQWIPIVTKFAAKHRLIIEEISYSLVQNANVVANLFGTAQVRSCMAPYYCGRCKENFTIKVTGEEVAGAPTGPPEKTCGRCSSVLEFDELDGYFEFFKGRSRR